MPLQSIKFRPGLNSVQTPTLNEGGWESAQNVRFFQGLPQKEAGWIDLGTIQDTPRALKAWTALSGNSYLASAGEQRTYVMVSGYFYDITPLTISSKIPLSISTTINQPTVTINDATDTPALGSTFQIVAPVFIAGLVLLGNYTVTATGAGSYSIVVAQNANATVISGGSVRTFTTAFGSPVVTVQAPSHGLFTGALTRVPVSTMAGGVTLYGNYLVTVLNLNAYTITATSAATSVQTVDENSGDLYVIFANPVSGGTQNNIPVSQTSADNWGEFLMTCGRGGPVNVWMPGKGVTTPTAPIATAPAINNFIFVSIQAQQLTCCGTVNAGTGLFDPMLIAWSDTGDYTNFIPAVGNAAGSFRLAIGSQITAALAMVGQNLIWTDLTVYSMQYVGQPLVWGFQPLGVNCGAVGPHSVGIVANSVYWMGQNQFFMLGPSGPQQLDCPVWDQVFANIDRANIQNVVCETDAYYGEVAWSVPQTDGSVLFVRLRADPNAPAWTATTFHHHTAWIDQNVFGSPIGGHENGLIDQHDVGVNGGGAVLPTILTSGMILISEGSQTVFVRDFLPDIDWLGTTASSLSLNLMFYDYPESTPRVAGPFILTPTTTVVHPRGRARAMQIELSGNDLDSNWRLGNCRFRGQPDGAR